MLPSTVHTALLPFRPDAVAAVVATCTTPDALDQAVQTGLVSRGRLQAAVERALRTNTLAQADWLSDPLWSVAEVTRLREDTNADWTTPMTAVGAMIIAHRVAEGAYRHWVRQIARRTPTWSVWFGLTVRVSSTPDELAVLVAQSPVVAAGLHTDRAAQEAVVNAPLPETPTAPAALRTPRRTRV